MQLQPAHAGDTTPGRGVICHRSLGPSLLPTSSAKTVTVISADIIYYNDVGQAFAPVPSALCRPMRSRRRALRRGGRSSRSRKIRATRRRSSRVPASITSAAGKSVRQAQATAIGRAAPNSKSPRVPRLRLKHAALTTGTRCSRRRRATAWHGNSARAIVLLAIVLLAVIP